MPVAALKRLVEYAQRFYDKDGNLRRNQPVREHIPHTREQHRHIFHMHQHAQPVPQGQYQQEHMPQSFAPQFQNGAQPIFAWMQQRACPVASAQPPQGQQLEKIVSKFSNFATNSLKFSFQQQNFCRHQVFRSSSAG